jgi:hypothetical protein
MTQIRSRPTLGIALCLTALISCAQAEDVQIIEKAVVHTVYAHDVLDGCIGDPDYPTSALSADGATILEIDDAFYVKTIDVASASSRLIEEPIPNASWGSMGANWITTDKAVIFMNDGKHAISVTTENPGGATSFWDTETWEDITEPLWPRGMSDDSHIKVSSDGRYAAIQGDGPKFGGCLSLVDFSDLSYSLLFGNKYDYFTSVRGNEVLKIMEGSISNGYSTVPFDFGFTPDSKYMVFKSSNTSYSLYSLATKTFHRQEFEREIIDDPRFAQRSIDDPAYALSHSELGDDYGIARVKNFWRSRNSLLR